jgi:hypothetical protein
MNMQWLKDLLKRIAKRSKKKPPKQKAKRGSGYRSREEWQADFERRFGKPGRIPEDV